jgi:ketopantoate reductase
MKTLVVGVGVIGTIYGWALSEAGTDVTHLVRGGRKTCLPDGVRLDVLDERKGRPRSNLSTYSLTCVDEVSPADNYEFIIVPTGTHQVRDALRELAPKAPGALFLLLTGVWEGLEPIDQLLPRNRYVLGYADGGGTIRDGVYWTNLGAEIHIGTPDGGSPDCLRRVTELFRQAGMRPDIQDNVLHWLWQHIASVVAFSAGFAKHRQLNAFLRDGELLRQCTLSTRELYQLCEHRGVGLKRYPEAAFRRWPVWMVVAFLKWNFRHNPSMRRYTAHAASDGNVTETGYYYDAILKTAREAGFAMPHTQALSRHLPPSAG